MIYAGKSVIINQEMKDCVSSVQIIKSQNFYTHLNIISISKTIAQNKLLAKSFLNLPYLFTLGWAIFYNYGLE